MNAFNYRAIRFFPSTLLAAAVAFCSTTTLAGTDSFFLERSDELINLHLAYNAKRWPVHANVHQQKTPAKSDIASFQEKPDKPYEMHAEKPATRGDQRRAPHSRKRR